MNQLFRIAQTIFFTLLPILLGAFNLSFAFSYEKIVSPAISLSAEPIANTVGKVIKETLDDETPYRIKTIVIDAGHGGKDPGCSGKHSREKHIALAVALNFGQQIEATFPEVRVIYTRSTDVFIPLHERAAIANRSNADLFISIHCNYIPKASFVNGSETYVLGLHRAKENLEVAKRENAAILLEENYEKNYGDFDPNSDEGHIILSMFQNAFLEQSIFFAEQIESRIATSAERHSRGVKQAGFLVLRETTMPSVLVETGFLSNRQEEDFLTTAEGQLSMATALFEAFQDYKNAIESPVFATAIADPIATTATQSPDTAPAKIPEASSVPTMKWDEPVAQTVKQTQQTQSSPTPKTQKYELAQTKAMKSEEYVDQQIQLLDAEGRAREETSIPVPDNVQANASVAKEFTPDPFEQSTRPSNTSTGRPVMVAKRETPATYNRNTVTARSGTSTASTRTPVQSTPTPTQTTSIPRSSVRFRVQLAATPNMINTNSEKWQKLTYLVEIIEENELYKYQVRNIDSYEKALEVKANLHRQGFTDAFLVAYDGQKRIDITEAFQTIGPK